MEIPKDRIDVLTPEVRGEELAEDALRNGRTVVAVRTEDDDADAVRGALVLAGTETVDRAKETWWLGVRDVEKEKYTADANFDHDERDFRSGFEAALQLQNRNRSSDECYQALADGDALVPEQGIVKHGYERGQQYLAAF